MRASTAAFALLVFERMLPSLIAFSKDTARDASCYLTARDAAWVALQNGKDGVADQSLNGACTTPPSGTAPSVPPVKLYKTVKAPAISSLNTVPKPKAPPPEVVP